MLSSMKSLVRRITLRRFSISSPRCSNEGSSSDGNDDRKGKAKEKLNSLLQTIIQDESLVQEDPPRLEAAPRPTLREKRVKERSERNLGEKIVNAAEKVAQTIEGDAEKNEAKLLHKIVEQDEKLKKSVLKAARNSTLSLLLAELNVDKEKEPRRQSPSMRPNDSTMASLNDEQWGTSRANMMRSKYDRPAPRGRFESKFYSQTIDLYNGRPLGIFNPNVEYTTGPKVTTWDQCAARELKLAFTHPPRNIWEQMIVWTDKGLLWKFPINNEQGLEKEEEVSFTEHVFLEAHLEGWCPRLGPIRQFMELVCVGLSRNHWLSAEEKRDHILWYKEYFLSKKQLIKELGAGEVTESNQPSAASV